MEVVYQDFDDEDEEDIPDEDVDSSCRDQVQERIVKRESLTGGLVHSFLAGGPFSQFSVNNMSMSDSTDIM